MYEHIFEKLRNENLLATNNKTNPWVDRRISDNLRKEIIEITSFLERDYNIADRIAILKLNVDKSPKCPVCGNETVYERSKKNFLVTCSPSCGSKYAQPGRAKTNLEKCGSVCNLSILPKEQKTENGRKGALEGRRRLKEKHGVENPMDLPHVKKKHKEKVSSREFQDRRFATLLSMPVKEIKYDIDEWHGYRKAVDHFTRHAGIETLEHYEKRGRSGIPGAYQLDHIISIFEGYVKQIPPEVIGGRDNLRYIPWEENRTKSCKTVIEENINNIEKFYV